MKKYTKPVKKITLIRDKLGINTIPDMLENSFSKYRDKTALVRINNNGIEKYTYSEVFSTTTKIARYLKELGLEKGDHIAILAENRPEWGISFFSISWIGAVAIPLDARASLETLKYILNFSDAKAIFFSQLFLKYVEEIKEKLKSLEHCILMESINEICSKYSEGIEKEKVNENDLSDILFTSGTTGNPKGVMLTHGNIMSNVEDIYSILDINPGDRAFSILPIHHSYERTGGFLATLYSGLAIYYGRGLKPREMLADLKTTKPTVWLNAPLILEKLYNRISKKLNNQKGTKSLITKIIPKKMIGKRIKKQLGLENLNLLVSGGAALPSWVSMGFRELGFTVIQGYGLSEASPLVSINPPSAPKDQSVGMLIQSNEAEIKDLDSDGNGEIYVRGPNIMKGYYNNKSATDEVLTTDGWLKTGDIGHFDEDGYLYITGRKKFVIVTPGGKNIFPEEIEEKLTKSSNIEEVMIFSPDDNQIQALIYPNIDEIKHNLKDQDINIKDNSVWNLIEREIREINKSLESYKRISKFAIKTEEFPKTSTRKIKRYLFRDLSLNSETKYL